MTAVQKRAARKLQQRAEAKQRAEDAYREALVEAVDAFSSGRGPGYAPVAELLGVSRQAVRDAVQVARRSP